MVYLLPNTMCKMIYQIHKKEETNETIQPASQQVQNCFQWNVDWQKRDLLPEFLNAMFYSLTSLPIMLHVVLLPSTIGSPGFPPSLMLHLHSWFLQMDLFFKVFTGQQ